MTPPPELARLAAALRQKRRAMAITQTELARRVGISLNQYNNAENGRNYFSLPVYFRLCKELDAGKPPLQ